MCGTGYRGGLRNRAGEWPPCVELLILRTEPPVSVNGALQFVHLISWQQAAYALLARAFDASGGGRPHMCCCGMVAFMVCALQESH